MDPTSGDKPGGHDGEARSPSVTRRIKWPEPGQAPNEEPSPLEPPSRRANMLWYSAAGVVVIVCAVAIVAMRRRATESVPAAAAAPKPAFALSVQKPAPVVEPLPKPTPPTVAQPPKPVMAPTEPAPRPTTAPASPAPIKSPNPYEALLAEGEQAFGKRQLDRARAAFERAARARPGAAAPEYGLGRCLVQEGDPAGAADHFRRAAQAGLAESWFDLGEAQRVLSRNDDALESYRKYLASGGGKRAGRARKLVGELGTP